MDLFSTTPGRPAFFAGTFNGHPPTAAAALATIDKLQREPVHEHVFRARRAHARRACASSTRASACRRTSAASARSSSRTSSRATPTSYDDLLANDVELFVGYRRELMNHGIFELPLNLKRSHFSYAHTDDDVDRLLEATEEAVQTVLAARG